MRKHFADFLAWLDADKDDEFGGSVAGSWQAWHTRSLEKQRSLSTITRCCQVGAGLLFKCATLFGATAALRVRPENSPSVRSVLVLFCALGALALSMGFQMLVGRRFVGSLFGRRNRWTHFLYRWCLRLLFVPLYVLLVWRIVFRASILVYGQTAPRTNIKCYQLLCVVEALAVGSSTAESRIATYISVRTEVDPITNGASDLWINCYTIVVIGFVSLAIAVQSLAMLRPPPLSEGVKAWPIRRSTLRFVACYHRELDHWVGTILYLCLLLLSLLPIAYLHSRVLFNRAFASEAASYSKRRHMLLAARALDISGHLHQLRLLVRRAHIRIVASCCYCCASSRYAEVPTGALQAQLAPPEESIYTTIDEREQGGGGLAAEPSFSRPKLRRAAESSAKALLDAAARAEAAAVAAADADAAADDDNDAEEGMDAFDFESTRLVCLGPEPRAVPAPRQVVLRGGAQASAELWNPMDSSAEREAMPVALGQAQRDLLASSLLANSRVAAGAGGTGPLVNRLGRSESMEENPMDCGGVTSAIGVGGPVVGGPPACAPLPAVGFSPAGSPVADKGGNFKAASGSSEPAEVLLPVGELSLPLRISLLRGLIEPVATYFGQRFGFQRHFTDEATGQLHPSSVANQVEHVAGLLAHRMDALPTRPFQLAFQVRTEQPNPICQRAPSPISPRIASPSSPHHSLPHASSSLSLRASSQRWPRFTTRCSPTTGGGCGTSGCHRA